MGNAYDIGNINLFDSDQAVARAIWTRVCYISVDIATYIRLGWNIEKVIISVLRVLTQNLGSFKNINTRKKNALKQAFYKRFHFSPI